LAPLIAGIVSTLISNNLPKLAQAVVDKGVDYVEEKTGIKLQPDMSKEEIERLRVEAQKHEEFVITENNKNTADARDMQKVALGQEDTFSKRFVYYLASFWSLCTAAYIAGITFFVIPPDNTRVVDTILGFLLGTIIATIVNYFFGTSNSSRAKTDIIAGIKSDSQSKK
jgi:hypothetical protein